MGMHELLEEILIRVKVKVGVEHFLSISINYFYIRIWSCMKLEDVLRVFPTLVPDNYLDRYIFIQGDVNNVPKNSK